MTKDGFTEFQHSFEQSGLPLMVYLQQSEISYSTYYYWRKKFGLPSDTASVLAPIAFSSSPSSSVTPETISTGTTLLFPNGLRAHFGPGSEKVLMELFDKSLSPSTYLQNLPMHIRLLTDGRTSLISSVCR